MLNVINGIIVDTFQSLREENSEKQRTLKEICYICSLSSAKLETNGVDYKIHITNEHNIINYLQYLYKIKTMDPVKMNGIDIQVHKKLMDNRISFFPIKKSYSMDQKNK